MAPHVDTYSSVLRYFLYLHAAPRFIFERSVEQGMVALGRINIEWWGRGQSARYY